MSWGRGDGEGAPPPPPRYSQTYQFSLPQKSVAALVPGGGVPERSLDLDQPPGSLCAIPHTGHNSESGGREPIISQVPPV